MLRHQDCSKHKISATGVFAMNFVMVFIFGFAKFRLLEAKLRTSKVWPPKIFGYRENFQCKWHTKYLPESVTRFLNAQGFRTTSRFAVSC